MKPMLLNPDCSQELPTEQLKLSLEGGPRQLYFHQLYQIIMTCSKDRNHHSRLRLHKRYLLKKSKSHKNNKTYLNRQTLNIIFNPL